MKKKQVVVTGMGVISPLGNNKEDFWLSLARGKSGVGKLTHFDAGAFASRIAGEVNDFEPCPRLGKKESRRMDRFTQFAVVAALDAVEDARLNLGEEDVDRIGVLIGSGIGGLATIEKQHNILLEKGPSKVSPDRKSVV